MLSPNVFRAFIFVKLLENNFFKFIINNMKRKLLLLSIIYIIMPIIQNPFNGFCRLPSVSLRAFAEESLKINNINFDNSDSIIFLGTSSNENTSEIKITKKQLNDPERTFFDIENAVITFPNKTFEIKNSRMTQVKIAQNSVSPDIVRIVIYTSKNYDSSQLKVLKIKNDIIIKLSNEIPLQKYLTQIYKETGGSSVKYYDTATVIPEETKPETTEADEIFNRVQQAFKEDSQELVRPNIEQKQARLKSRFFLDKVLVKDGNILLSGIGVINLEKPFTLTEPSRIVFDLPNTVVLQELRDKEFILSDNETIKIGQFEPSKARVVIKTATPELYRPVYSANLQSLLIANQNRPLNSVLSETFADLTLFKEQNVNSTTDVINVIFSKPVIYSIKKERNALNVIFYNLTNFDVNSFNITAKKNQNGFGAKQLGANVYQMTFPVSQTTYVDCYETLNASQLRFVFTKKEEKRPPEITIELPTKRETPEIKKENPFSDLLTQSIKKQQKITKKKTKEEKLSVPKKIKNKVIVIDAGHGGADTGAMRGNTLEKDLTLDIALRVEQILQERGLKKVVMTRRSDETLSLARRVEIANEKNADIYISIHINASVKTEIKGIETHYYTEKGYDVAKIIHEELIENIDTEDRGLFKSKFYVINHTEAPAVLLELGFISNEYERSKLCSDTRQKESAEAIAEGIINYLTEY